MGFNSGFKGLICSKSPPDDDTGGSKRVAVRILYKKLCFSGYLMIPFFTVQHTTGRIIEKFTNSN